MIAAVPCMGVFSQVSIDWSRYLISWVLHSWLWYGTTYIDTSKLGTVPIESVVVKV